MEKEIAEGNIGNVGKYDVEFKGGKLVAMADAKADPVPGVAVSAQVKIELGADAVIDAIARAIPGQVDDAVFGLIKAALAS